MTTFYICRHGQTENNKKKLFSGWIDTPLTMLGKENAQPSATKLKEVRFDKIISSDMGRAFMTAYLIAQELGYKKEIQTTPELREVNYGDFTNMPLSVYPNMTPEQNADYICPNGESLRQMQRRVKKYLEIFAASHDDQTILITAHDGTINAIRSLVAGMDIGTADLTRNPHDFVGRFTVHDNQFEEFEELV